MSEEKGRYWRKTGINKGINRKQKLNCDVMFDKCLEVFDELFYDSLHDDPIVVLGILTEHHQQRHHLHHRQQQQK